MIKDSSTGYGLMTILLHWICAVLIFGLFGLGFYMTGLDYYSEWYHKGPVLHISLGLLLLLLMIFRVTWRLFNKKPEPLPTYSSKVRFSSTAVKYILITFVFVVIVSGYFVTTAEGKPAVMFDIVSFPSITELNSTQVDLAGDIHELVAWATVLVASFHALAALLHHFFFRDRTLVRMLKPVKSSISKE